MARVLLSPALPLADLARAAVQSGICRFSVGRRRSQTQSLAARPDRLSDRRRRYAPALAYRLDAQPRAHDRGLVPDQAPPAFLGRPERPGSGIRSSTPIWRRTQPVGSGLRALAPMPRPTSAFSIPSRRVRNSIPRRPTFADWVPEIAKLPDDVIHAPWTASAAGSGEGRRRSRKIVSVADRRPRRRPPACARRLCRDAHLIDPLDPRPLVMIPISFVLEPALAAAAGKVMLTTPVS